MNIIDHKHVHSIAELAAILEEYERIVAEKLGPPVAWVSFTEMAEVTEDHYDYMLARVHDRDRSSLSGIPGWYPPQKEKECMFKKEK